MRDNYEIARVKLCDALKTGDRERVRYFVRILSRRFRRGYSWLWKPDRSALQKYYDAYGRDKI